MRLAASGKGLTAVLVVVTVLGGCQSNAAPDRAAADRSRAQAVPAARELYRTLFEASARSVHLLDWGYQPCGTAATTLTYSISMRLFAFTPIQNTHFGAYRQRVVSLVRALDWTMQRRLSTRTVTLPTVPSAYYRLSRRDGTISLTGKLSLAGDVNPLVGVSGILTVNGPCFDAKSAARSLQRRSGSPPFSMPRPSPSHS